MKTISKRLTDGQDLMIEIRKLLDEHAVEAGVILSAVGSLKQSNIRVPVIEGEVKYIHPENVELMRFMEQFQKTVVTYTLLLLILMAGHGVAISRKAVLSAQHASW